MMSLWRHRTTTVVLTLKLGHELDKTMLYLTTMLYCMSIIYVHDMVELSGDGVKAIFFYVFLNLMSVQKALGKLSKYVGASCIEQSTCYEWYKIFCQWCRNGRPFNVGNLWYYHKYHIRTIRCIFEMDKWVPHTFQYDNACSHVAFRTLQKVYVFRSDVRHTLYSLDIASIWFTLISLQLNCSEVMSKEQRCGKMSVWFLCFWLTKGLPQIDLQTLTAIGEGYQLQCNGECVNDTMEYCWSPVPLFETFFTARYIHSTCHASINGTLSDCEATS